MAMQPEYKPYLVCGAGFLISAYLLAFLFLALLTTINDWAGYPLHNFLGSDVDLQAAVLQLLPAQNPYHLQKWESLPVLTFLLSLLSFVLAIIITLRFARQILAQGSARLVVFIVFITALAGLTFAETYQSIGRFIIALAQA